MNRIQCLCNTDSRFIAPLAPLIWYNNKNKLYIENLICFLYWLHHNVITNDYNIQKLRELLLELDD